VSRVGYPDGLTPSEYICGDLQTGPSGAGYEHVVGPATPPLQQGSLEVTVSAAGRAPGLTYFPSGGWPAPTNLTVWEVAARTSATGTTAISLFAVNTSSDGLWAGTASIPVSANTWQPLDFAGANYHWIPISESGTEFDATLAGFAAAKAGASIFGGGIQVSCTSAPVYFDAFRIGTDASAYVVDFEAPFPTSMTPRPALPRSPPEGRRCSGRASCGPAVSPSPAPR